MISPTSTLPRHWKTCLDEDGDPYGEVCECALGRDHDEFEHPEDECGDCQGSGQAFGNDALLCDCDCHPLPASPSTPEV